jgi:S1-C subfamily serine protease
VNLLDLFLLAALVAAVVGGYRLGFLARLFSWLGLALGAVLALKFSGTLARVLDRSSEQTRLIAVLGLFVAVAMIGQGLGLALGTLLHVQIRATDHVPRGDRVAGATVGGLGILCVVWLVTPALADVPGWPAREADSSAIVRAVHRLTPDPPELANDLGGLVDADGTPFLQDFGSGPHEVPEVDRLSDEVERLTGQSTVQVSGRACNRIQEGSGFVAAPGLIMTNAHVVAGETFTEIETLDGERREVRVVAFEPDADVAVLAVEGLDLVPLEIALPDADVEGISGAAVFGHPGGRRLNIRATDVEERISARGTDIYREASTQREVLVLAALMFPGDSGAPLVAPDGTVIGLAFAIDPKHRDAETAVSYALATSEIWPVLDDLAAVDGELPTGDCIAEA